MIVERDWNDHIREDIIESKDSSEIYDCEV